MISLALDPNDYKGGRYNLYLGFLGNVSSGESIETFGGLPLLTFSGESINTFGTGSVDGVVGAIKIFSGLMDMMSIDDGGETSTISLSVENRLTGLLRPRTLRYTDQEQRAMFPDDGAFKYLTAIQGANTDWGKAS